jgi:predicted DNA-binding protein with PD1-like motif
MHGSSLVLTFVCIAWAAEAQVTRTEVLRPTTPIDDAKPNSYSVPDVSVTAGQFQKILVVRGKYQTDLLRDLERAVSEQKVRNAVILSAIGSVRSYHNHGVINRTFPSNNVYVKDPTGAADITNMNGYIIDGRVHAHVTFADGERAFGGHLEPGTEVFTFAIVTIGVLSDDIDLSRADDKTYR